MEDYNAILAQIKDLAERAKVLRGYL